MGKHIGVVILSTTGYGQFLQWSKLINTEVCVKFEEKKMVYQIVTEHSRNFVTTSKPEKRIESVFISTMERFWYPPKDFWCQEESLSLNK